MFKRLMTLVLTLGVAAGAHAAAATPDQALRGTTEQIQKLIKDNYKTYRADLPTFYKAVDEVVVPRFDVPYIAQLVLATHYKTASAEQRSRFAQSFKNMLVRAYGNAMLDNYNSIQIEWLPVRVDGDKALVNTSMSSGGGQKYAIGFRVRKVNDDWKVFDIAVEGLSLITNFRTQLKAEIEKSGLDDVIRRMESGDFAKAAPGAG